MRFTIHNDASVTPTRPLRLIETTVNRRAGQAGGVRADLVAVGQGRSLT